MTTPIVPAIGNGASLLQLGPGATGYGAIDWRRMLGAAQLQEGALGGGSYKVTAGAGMTVSIAASTGEGLIVQGDSITSQGIYYVAPHTIAIIENITPAHATLPRIDQIVCEVLDAAHDGGASNRPATRPIDGVATAAATLDNRNGAAALPATTMRLADVLVPAASSSIVAGNIRDRRQRARGAYNRILRNANAAAGSDYTTSSGTMVDVDATNLTARIECSGVPLTFSLRGRMSNAASGNQAGVGFVNDGAGVDGSTPALMYAGHTAVAGGEVPLDFTWPFIPTAGSHVFKPQWMISGASASSLFARASVPLVLEIREDLRENSNNN